jgi:hypothetical protein
MSIDVAIIGSGVAALKVYSILFHSRNLNPLIIDFSPLGGILASANFVYKYPRIPIFIDSNIINLFTTCNPLCYHLEVCILKEGDIIDKIKGFAPFDVQRLWIYELAEKKTACFLPHLSKCILALLNVGNETIRRVRDSIRKVDITNKVIATLQGLTFRYKSLIYTWPLDLLMKIISNINDPSISALINDVINKAKYVSIYTRSYVIYEKSSKYDEPKIELYLHGTKASRVHTIIKIPIANNITLLYALTSYSEYYPLLPGIGDKIHSELKRHKVLTPSMQVLDYSDTNIVYGFLNTLPEEALEKVKEKLQGYNIMLFGRIAEWREYDVPSLLFKRDLHIKIHK